MTGEGPVGRVRSAVEALEPLAGSCPWCELTLAAMSAVVVEVAPSPEWLRQVTGAAAYMQGCDHHVIEAAADDGARVRRLASCDDPAPGA